MVWVGQYSVEVDHAVEAAAGPNPLVDLLADSLLDIRVVSLHVDAFEGIQSATNYFNAASVRSRNQLTVAIYQFFGSARVGWISQRESSQCGARKPDVVQSFEQHDMRHARHIQAVPVKTGQSTGT